MKLEEKFIDLRKTDRKNQVLKVNEILTQRIVKVTILTDQEVIIKMIPIQITDKDLSCKMKIINNYWEVILTKKERKKDGKS